MKGLAIVLFALLTVQTVSAKSTGFTDKQKSSIVDNLTKAITSENTGLQTSGALILSDLINGSYLEGSDATKAMIPLLKILRSDKTERERIVAAVALYQLGNKIGIYQLRGVALFDSNKRLATICKNLYYTYHKLHGTEYLINF
jgi:HEAT repeat protein